MEQTEQSIQRSGNLNPMFGKRHSEETKERISITQKARYAAIRKAIHEREDILDYGDDAPPPKLEDAYCDTCLTIMIYASIM